MASPNAEEEAIEAVVKALRSGRWIKGGLVEELGEKFAEFVGAKHGIAVSSGTTALLLALKAHNIQAGDGVITTPFSFIASTSQIIELGAEPVFVDIDPLTYNLDSKLQVEWLPPWVKAILPVHLYGHPADMDRIETIARQNSWVIIEDACQAHGARYKTRQIGSRNTCCWSLFPTKNLATCGDGGIVTTNDDEIARRIRLLRDHGRTGHYEHVTIGSYIGGNYRLSEVQAAFALSQLKRLPHDLNMRLKNAALYFDLLKDLPGIVLPYPCYGSLPVYHQFTIRVTKDCLVNRDELKLQLDKAGIDTGIHYPIPIHRQPAIIDLDLAGILYQSLSEAERAAREVLSLPVHPGLTENDIRRVAFSIERIIVEKMKKR